MSLRINTNVTAINALRNLNQTSAAVATSIERLSSGLRINRSADDPAGLIVSEGLRAQISGLTQAISNSQDANNLIKTAEGGLAEINSLLNSVRQLAVHAANTGVNDSTAVQADQTQIASAIESADRIASQSQFGTKRLLDGTSGVSSAVTDVARVAGISISGNFGGVATLSGNVTINVDNAATRASASGSATYASVDATLATVNGTTTGFGGTVVINGQSVVVTGAETVQTLINKINNVASVTGVSADFTQANGSGSIILTQQSYGGNFKIVEAESSSLIFGAAGTSVSGLNATVTVTALASVNNATTAVIATFVGGRSSTDSGLRVTDSNGNSLLLTESGNIDIGVDYNVAAVNQGALQFQIGGNAGQSVRLSIGNVESSSLGNTSIAGLSLKTIDVTTAQGATNAITVLDEAIKQVSVLRAQLGSFQKNTIESTQRYLGVGIENLAASESQIRDTNVAEEVTKLTKNQILQQAGTSVLAQANSAPQLALSLLRG